MSRDIPTELESVSVIPDPEAACRVIRANLNFVDNAVIDAIANGISEGVFIILRSRITGRLLMHTVDDDGRDIYFAVLKNGLLRIY